MKFKQKCDIICIFGARGGLGSQWPFGKFPALDVTKAVITKVCAMEFGDGVAESGKGAADLAVTAFAHLDNPAAVVAVVLAFQCQLAGPIR